MERPGLLLIGCGAFGRVHLAALKRLGAPVTVFDADRGLAAATGEAVADSLEAGLAACDAAIVATPVPTHVAVAGAVLRAGRDLFLEKPATETADEAAAVAIGDVVQVGTWFMNRCDYLDPALAWVGVKDSGRGCTLSTVGYEHLTRPKSFHLRTRT